MSFNFEDLPLSPPPPGVASNFQDPENLAYPVNVVCTICLCVLAAVAAVRAYTKVMLLKTRTRDDIPYFAALTICIAFVVIIVIVVNRGITGKHAWDVQLKVLTVDYMRLMLVLMLNYSTVVWFAKVPLLVMYLEIFGRIRWLRYSVWTVLILTGLFHLASMIILAVFCSPRTGYGQLDYANALGCMQWSIPLSLIQGSISIALDLFLLFLPMQPIWSLQLSTRRKLAISTLVLTGIFAVICSCVAMWFRVVQSRAEQAAQGDDTWTAAPLQMAMVTEITCAMVIPAAPSMSIFWTRKIVPFSTTYFSTHHRWLGSHKSSDSLPEYCDSDLESAKSKTGNTMMTREDTV